MQDLSHSGTGVGMDFCCQTALGGDADDVETHCTSFHLPCADPVLLCCHNSRCQALERGHVGFFIGMHEKRGVRCCGEDART